MLFIGAISSAEALKIESNSVQNLLNEQEQSVDKTNPEAVKKAQEKAKAAAQKAAESKKKIDDLKSKKEKKSAAAKESKPDASAKLQTSQEMDVKTNTGLVVSVEAVKKPENANKVQELAAMEEALKKATEEAHKQRVALTGGAPQSLSETTVQSKALEQLKSQQEAQQQELLRQLQEEEKQRQMEIKQSEELEAKITATEQERK